ncbi:unnamed protein product [Calypogeia fissa]
MASGGKFCFAVALVALLVFGTRGASQTVTQILLQNGLPQGLLPATVTSYSLAENGKFQVHLRSACTTQIGGHTVNYKTTITGELSYGLIDNLGGIQVRKVFWFSVNSMEIDPKDPNTIWLKVGYISAALSTDYFQVPPVCNSLKSDEEADEDGVPENAMTLSEWLSEALRGALAVNEPNIPDSGAVRKLLQ